MQALLRMDHSRQQEFVALDVETLSRDDAPKVLLKKGSIGIDRKATLATADGGESFKETVPLRGEVTSSLEKSVIVVHSSLPGTPQARTASFRRRRDTSPPLWRDPRRVLLFFATLSSMGTIILLYFTLSMGKMDGMDEANTSW